ncbi:hypothetical protein FRC00_014421 [Tulasnella sp. 408]|nr:hypothetical protein FRC00_014421 [Tulasnella sp. 408]
MATPAHNVSPPTIDKIPPPPREFGKDGGKFYRYYDNMAEEVDEDLTKGLKEQLDGLLIFTNAILLQLALGKNVSLPEDSIAPSKTFAPAAGVVTVNVLFSLSLTFALISSFVAVLGRQWLIYYRKRSGAGPDHQRWEQLRRFLGAKVWSLELILDDLLPLLLQAGLLTFCIAFTVYLQILNVKVSNFVAIALYTSLAVFVCSAVGAAWDPFCPFQSPLSHFLSWLLPKIKLLQQQILHTPDIPQLILGPRRPRPRPDATVPIVPLPAGASSIPGLGIYFEMVNIVLMDTYNTVLEVMEGREPVLQVIAAKRVACTSDDPETLLITMTNLLTINDRRSLQQLWSDQNFRDRLLELCKTAYDRTLEWQGRDKTELARASALFYRACLSHILMSVRNYYDSAIEQDLWTICERDVATADTRWLFGQSITEFPPSLIDASLSWWLIQSFVNNTSWSWIIVRVTDYSEALAKPRWRLLSLIINAVITENRYYVDQIEPYNALPLGLNPLGCAHLLSGILECATKLIASAEADVNVGSEERLTLIRVMEMYLREAKRNKGDEGDQNEDDGKAREDKEITERILPLWQSSRIVLLLEDVWGFGVKDYTCNENRTLLDSLDPLIRQLEDRFLHSDNSTPPGGGTIVELRHFFNNFSSDVKKVSERVSQRVIPQAPGQEAAQASASEDAQPRLALDRVGTPAARP